MKNPSIKQITLNDCLPLRHQVLWPMLTMQECIDPEDEHSIHMGYCINDRVISCLSIFPHSSTHHQVRKFATHPSFQGQGIGSTLFTRVLATCKKEGISLISLNARMTAIQFYKKFNFHICGKEYSKKNLSFIPMQLALKNFKESNPILPMK